MTPEKILVVADDPRLTALLRGLLTRRDGFQVEEENLAFGICTALEFSPDLIIVDVDTPNPEGCRLITDLRQLPPFAELPIICLSAFLAASQGAQKAGETYLAKPIDPTRLVAMVRGLLPTKAMGPAPRRRFLRPREDSPRPAIHILRPERTDAAAAGSAIRAA